MSAPALPGQDRSSTNQFMIALRSIRPREDLTRLLQHPCARNALLIGIGGGTAVGAIRFLGSQRVWSSTNWAVATFGFASLTSWETCNRSRKAEGQRIQAAREAFKHASKGKKWAATTTSGAGVGKTETPVVAGESAAQVDGQGETADRVDYGLR
ncbi:uncharacterized protein L969DRAFT_64108 [Mixia osmundae IAM 14324]|uniref:Cytochrome c oxidase assembly protein COX20, mitochondrial n=1 Tax=Mixia osmundae (strain CBS 9802 / IAM 14324 / JCM 22182 / KY 12970) TaxID=764103 RepID=G7E7M7_MIXOS|nr:uncharacterized protein L969DRAFT_64108 [Mixia osmundae IAM 14324]KEI38437.1 hypothetical protein L969DRAFT_64108 [Mixia osmundae IAM 14324]GAA98837.1 hypothetical protein E5Q_05525 [Mixia osmundae IAM 14324]